MSCIGLSIEPFAIYVPLSQTKLLNRKYESTPKMASMHDIRNAQSASGVATILAIGTANPPNVIYQAEYPDFYFRVTNSEHLVALKNKFKRICMFAFYLFS